MPPKKTTLLQLLPFPVLPDFQSRAARDCHVIELWNETDPDAVIQAHRDDITVLVTSAMMSTPASLIDKLPNLKAICSNGVGYDSIDVQHAHKKGIQVSNTPDVLNDCVADLTWGLILACARTLGRAERHVRANQWGRSSLPLGTKVTGKKLGIVGLGRVGQAIAERSVGFKMDVRYHNRNPRADAPWTYEGSLMELARWADFLVIATVGGASTRHLIDQNVMETLGPNGILINISRGSVVDEAALIEALTNGRLGGAGLDVFDVEPNVPDALKTLENVVILPHIASATIETRQAMASLVLDNVDAFIETGKVITPIPG